MSAKLAIDFGTTNTVVVGWDQARQASEVLTLPGLGLLPAEGIPSLVPSLIYVKDGVKREAVAGQAVHADRLDQQKDNRLFRNFKRGIVASPAPEPREIDGVLWGDSDAGQVFIAQLIAALPAQQTDLDQLVLTAPVSSFESYLAWLSDTISSAIGDLAAEKVRIVDESTAAALGYAVTQPHAVVLVFDFGGGTLDLSLVQLPESREKTGSFLGRFRRSNLEQSTAKVIAKAGRIFGGSDIDQWLLNDVLKRSGIQPSALGKDYATLLTRCEQAKIALSTDDSAVIDFDLGIQHHTVTVTRADLETLLEQNGFYTALRNVIDKVMHVGHRRGIFKEDIHYVLLVGGMSLMPSVQQLLRHYFSDTAIRADKPFTAVAEGAIQVAMGMGLDDYLVHSYGLRYLDPLSSIHRYDEIIPMGSKYPSEEPVEVILSAAHDQQSVMEFVIGEIDSDATAMIQVKYDADGQAVFMAQVDGNEQQIVALNESEALAVLAKLDPPGSPPTDRIKAVFAVDDRRQLRLTATDLKTGKTLLEDVIVVGLR